MQTFTRAALAGVITSAIATAFVPAIASAASDSAWDEMRADVSAKCLAAAAENVEAGKAVVDPFGSQSFGLALVSGKPKGTDGHVSLICVYDKRTKTVEIGGELSDEMIGAAR